jgi:polyphenol oxidase
VGRGSAPGRRLGNTHRMDALSPALTRRRLGSLEVLADRAAAERGWLIAFTDRAGGTSHPPYESLNLSGRVGDDDASVRANRDAVGEALSFDPGQLVLSNQVHGSDVLEVTPGDAGVIGPADVLVVRTPGPIAAILTADCAPVAVAGSDALAIAHAGWRGLVGGAIERAIQVVGEPIAAWVGPCIHSCCYTVGADVVERFRDRGLPVQAPERVDPARAAEAILRRSGVRHLSVATECTSCDPRYFSYRRDGVTGRQAGLVALLPSA